MSGRYLVTGVAGSGKTTLEKLFREKGYVTIDVDDGLAQWRHAETNELLPYTPEIESWHSVAEWVVDIDKLQEHFDAHANETVLVFGAFARMKTMVPRFNKIFLLEYKDEETARQRIAGRDGGYGKNDHELQRVLSYIQPYQEKMKAAGAVPLDCSLPLDQIVARIEKEI